MSAIGDSSAERDDDRSWPQHQAFVTLLQGRIADPAAAISWLDLACGRGQIIARLSDQLDAGHLNRITYHGIDIRQEYAQRTEQTASGLGLASFQIKVGELGDFNTSFSSGARYDFISLTNVVHEIPPSQFASILVDGIARLADDGIMYVYDMESIDPFELGAIAWSRDDVRQLTISLCDVLGATSYRPAVGRWFHRTRNGWSTQIHRQHLSISNKTLASKIAAAKQSIASSTTEIMNRKLESCRGALEALTRYPAETPEEQKKKVSLLYDFWALSRMLGSKQ